MLYNRFLLNVLLCTVGLSTFAQNGKDLLSQRLPIWVHKLTWSEDQGFSIELRGKNTPLVFVEKGKTRTEIENENLIKLECGSLYLLTNGRGRSQTFQLEPNSKFDQDVLLFMHVESRENGAPISETRYFIMSDGCVYDNASNLLVKLSFPLVLPDPLRMRESYEKMVDDVAQRYCEMAKEERTCAIDFIRNNPTQLELAVGATNSICYSKIVPQTAEDILGMVQPGKSSKVLERLLADMPKKRGGGVEKWGRVCRTSRGSVVVGISLLNFGVSEKYFSFYETGNLNFMLERWRTTGRVIVRHYNPHGSLDWRVRSEDDKVVEYWRRENGELNEMKVDSTTHSLIEAAYKTFSDYRGLQKSTSSGG